jgi:hypothetical protein
MKSPLEDNGPAAPRGAAAVPKPAGGKALLRILTQLDSRGLHAIADATIAAATTDESKPQVKAARDALSAAPPMEGAPQAVELAAPGTEVAAEVASLYATSVPHTPDPAEPQTGTAPGARSVPDAAAVPQAEAAPPGPPMSPPTASGPQWRSLGPWTVPNGQTYGSSRVNVSGRVSCIAIHPTNPARVLCGSASGGVWESFDRGASWAPRTDYASTLTVGALAYDRTNPNIAYCGLGEGNAFWWVGNGILRSTNGGTTWAPLVTAPFVGQGFYDLQVSPSDGQRLVAATTGGLYVSTTGGAAWTQRRSRMTWSLSIAPGPVATSEMLAGCNDGVFRSVDGGTTWSAVAIGGAPAAWDRLAVAIAPSNPTVAYAWGARGSTAYLFRRAGGTWTALPLPSGVSTGQAWYDWFLGAAPDNDHQVYVGAIDCYRGDLSGGSWTWAALSNKGSSGDSIHPDQHAVAFEPGNPNMIYVGCDGGLYRSANRGINWTHCNNGLVITEMEYLAQDYGSARMLIGGTQDNGTEQWTGSSTWTHIADGDGGDCGINRSAPLTQFHSYYSMTLERSTSGGAFGSWTNIRPPVPAGEGSQFYPPFEVSANGGDTIAMAGDALYVSRNNGSAWTRLAYPSAARGSAMYIPDPNTVYVGVGDGRVFRTQWNGSAWPALTALTTPRASATVSDIKVDANNAQRIWVTYTTVNGGRVFRSDNGGASWLDRSAGLPALPITAVELDNANSTRVWVAADLGVYQSLDAGASWANFSASLPNCFIGDIVFHPHARLLRAGTRNRGVWEIDVDGPLAAPICATQFTGTLAANQTNRWFTFNWPATWHIVWTVMPTTPFAGGAQLTWSVAVQRSNAEFATYYITVQNLTNAAVTFEGRYAILSRY